MALRGFEPIPAKYYPKLKNSIEHDSKAINFMCAAYAPKETTVTRPVKGLITSTTKRVIYTSDERIDFSDRGYVEIFGEKLKITHLVEDETDMDMLGATKFKSSMIKKNIPKWMTLE